MGIARSHFLLDASLHHGLLVCGESKYSFFHSYVWRFWSISVEWKLKKKGGTGRKCGGICTLICSIKCISYSLLLILECFWCSCHFVEQDIWPMVFATINESHFCYFCVYFSLLNYGFTLQ